jgi:hypothetical protein
VQVKSRYHSDSDLGFPVHLKSLNAFDFLIVAFMNIGNFFGRRDDPDGACAPVFYTLPRQVIRRLHESTTSWHKVRLRGKGAHADSLQRRSRVRTHC